MIDATGFVPLVEAIATKRYNTETIIGLGAATALLGNISAEFTQTLLSMISAGAVGLAKEYIRRLPSGIPSLQGTSVKRIVNIWGTEDVLYKLGAAGNRSLLGGIGTINIEIQGATHFDYMRRADNDPNPPTQFNKDVSAFVARLILESNDETRLNNFLSNNCVKGADGIWRFTP